MRIGIPLESQDSQSLVAATADTVKKLVKLGYAVSVESGAGKKADCFDGQYEAAGAEIVSADRAWGADIVLTPDTPAENDLERIKPGAVLISRLSPRQNPQIAQKLCERKITGLSMDMIPRISRAQSMDVLSSMANIAGYRAVIEAAANFGRLFTGQVTAAGKMPPATVYVIGAGVAGLAAIGTANSMGAVVNATDVRSETAEQVESLGAHFVPIEAPAQESSDGYAREMSDAQKEAAFALYARQAEKSDVVITTANIPGRKSPILLDAQAVSRMKSGSVIVDMAAANGGNCELTVPGKIVTTENGVKIIGYTDLAGRLPAQASRLYAQNVVNFLQLATPGKDGKLVLDTEDEIVRQIIVTDGSQVLFPPPPVKVSAAPAQTGARAENDAMPPAPPEKKTGYAKYGWAAGIAAALMLLIFMAPPGMSGHFMIFALAVVIGFYVITSVTHSLHTPLMSVTNAVSGIIIVGALVQIPAQSLTVKILAFIGIAVASVNIFGGFAVTHRMLKMFQRS